MNLTPKCLSELSFSKVCTQKSYLNSLFSLRYKDEHERRRKKLNNTGNAS